jgi:hypothetical protein
MEALKEKRDNPGSSESNEPKETRRMLKPQVHTTKYGTQYVNVLDVIQSETGWAEIERILDANLVQEPVAQSRTTNPSSKNGDAA